MAETWPWQKQVQQQEEVVDDKARIKILEEQVKKLTERVGSLEALAVGGFTAACGIAAEIFKPVALEPRPATKKRGRRR